MTPTAIEYGNSPYTSSSGFAGNPLLISPESLIEEGLLDPQSLSNIIPPSNHIDYVAVSNLKREVVRGAYTKFRLSFKDYASDYEKFISDNSYWLEDYSLYKALREGSGKPWLLWPAPLRDREPAAMSGKRNSLGDIIALENFAQFIFFRQWNSLKEYCKKGGLKIIGDLPFYESYDGADVWAHPELFKLDEKRRPRFVSGVPPDYFSKTGQLWGHPVYDWEELKRTSFEFWARRIAHSLRLFDILRLDHFRGLLAYWEVPASERTAMSGRWVETPSDAFFKNLISNFPSLPFIAEDLGVITEDVRQAMARLNIPGMRVLVFAFSGSSDNPNLPHNHPENSVASTGTHDTNTVKGWFLEEATQEEKNNLFRYISREVSANEVSWEFIRLAMSSAANLCIIPVQDLLSLGAEARLNQPASPTNNYLWRLQEGQLTADVLDQLGEVTKAYGRE